MFNDSSWVCDKLKVRTSETYRQVTIDNDWFRFESVKLKQFITELNRTIKPLEPNHYKKFKPQTKRF